MVRQISVFVENESGRLAEITDVLAKANIDLRAMSIADTTDFGILRLIVDKPSEAQAALKEFGVTASTTDVIAVGIKDVPGGFSDAVKALSGAGIDIEYMYAFVSRKEGMAFVIVRVNDNDHALKVLKDAGILLLTEDDVLSL